MGLQHFKERLVRGSGDMEIFAREGGNPSGPPILLIHGYLFSADVFARQFSGALADTYRLVAMDVRGHGRSSKPDDEAAYLDARAHADDVARVVEAHGLERPLIVGWSMGSRIALNYGWHHGFDKIGGLNLVGAVVAGPTRGPNAPLTPELADMLSEDEAVRLRATAGFVSACGAGALDPEDAAAFTKMAMTVPVSSRRGSRRWPIMYAEMLPELETPLLVTHGISDMTVPEEASRELAGLTRAGRLSMIPGGHMPFFVSPTEFDNDLAAFAASVLEQKK